MVISVSDHHAKTVVGDIISIDGAHISMGRYKEIVGSLNTLIDISSKSPEGDATKVLSFLAGTLPDYDFAEKRKLLGGQVLSLPKDRYPQVTSTAKILLDRIMPDLHGRLNVNKQEAARIVARVLERKENGDFMLNNIDFVAVKPPVSNTKSNVIVLDEHRLG